jgi:hypothetical protein
MRRSARISVLAGHPRWIFFGRLAVLNLATQLCAFSAILTNRRVRRYEPGGTHCRRTVEKCEKSTAFHSITSSAGRCDRALWLSLGPEANGLDWNATAVGQNSTIALRLHPASSFGGGLCGLGKQSLGVEHSFRIRVPLKLCRVAGSWSLSPWSHQHRPITAPGTVLAALEAAKRQTSCPLWVKSGHCRA